MPYETLLSQLGWFSIEQMVSQRRLILLYKYHHGLRYLPENVIEPKTVIVNTRRNMNNSNQYKIPIVTRDRCSKTCIIQSISSWNVLSDNLIDMELSRFKKAVRHRRCDSLTFY